MRLNKKYLGRNHVTDVISFSYLEEQNGNSTRFIDGTLYCCAQQIEKQASEWNESRSSEYLRIIVHGVLHLVGYADATAGQKKVMRDKENLYLNKLG